MSLKLRIAAWRLARIRAKVDRVLAQREPPAPPPALGPAADDAFARFAEFVGSMPQPRYDWLVRALGPVEYQIVTATRNRWREQHPELTQ